MAPPRRLLELTAFAAGFGAMAAEMAAGRLVAPYFGTSTLVWCLLIGSVLSALALGTYLGGRWSAWPRALELACGALVVTGFYLCVLPFLARPILRRAVAGFHDSNLVVLALGALLVALMLMLPVAVLGAIGPVLVQRGAGAHDEVGAVAGRLGANGTLGSLLGTFVPGLVLVPLVGTNRCFVLAGALLAGAGLLGLRKRRAVLGAALATFVMLAAAAYAWPWSERDPATIYELESRSGYLRVTEQDGLRRLYLNDGYAVQTVARTDGAPYLRGVWGYYALAPSFTLGGAPSSVLVLGLGGGSSARRYAEDYPGAHVTGVELDAAVVDVARRYFGLPASVDVAIADGRSFLAGASERYDLIVVDAFQFPYVPFQLATEEFFALARAHLGPGGAFVINVGRKGEQHAVVDAVAITMARVFRHVSGAEVPGPSNTILVGSDHELTRSAGLAKLGLPPAEVHALERLPPVRSWPLAAGATVLTDDRAPVELLTDGIVLRELWRGFTGG